MKEIGTSDFKPGYKINKLVRNNSLNKQNNKKSEKSEDDLSLAYPNGMIPFILINAFFLIGSSVIFGIGFTTFADSFKFQWPNSVIAIGVSHLLLNLFWFIARLDQVALFGFGTLKFKRKINLARIKEKTKLYSHKQAIDDVETHDEFVAYCAERKKYTKKVFYISMIVSVSIFVLCLLIGLLCQTFYIPTITNL
ncbi:MAG: hypothetical protein ACRC4L_03895 [Mycoplasma sp.]